MNKQNKVKKVKKVHKKPTKKIAIISVIGMAVLIYCVYSIILLVQQPIGTFVIKNAKLSQEESAVGYVIRQETVVQGNNYTNGMIQIKSEGERVAKGESIFRYYSNNEETLVKKIQELDIKIQEALENETDLFSSDMKLLEKQIEEKLNELGKTNDVKKIIEYKKDINTKITKKAKIAGDLSPSGSYIKKLIDERTLYEKNLNSGAEYVNAPESGIVSYRVDGLEEILNPESFSTLNKKVLEDLNLKTGEIVASSEQNGKIINNFESYIATNLDSKESKSAKIGDSVKLRLSNSDEITAKIQYIIEENNSRLIIFKIANGVELLTSYRKITFDVIWWNYNGLKVPNSSLLVEKIENKTTKQTKDMYFLVRNRMGYTDKILVKILKQNDTYAIVKNYEIEELKEELGENSVQLVQNKSIMLYDEILINPDKKQ